MTEHCKCNEPTNASDGWRYRNKPDWPTHFRAQTAELRIPIALKERPGLTPKAEIGEYDGSDWEQLHVHDAGPEHLEFYIMSFAGGWNTEEKDTSSRRFYMSKERFRQMAKGVESWE